MQLPTCHHSPLAGLAQIHLDFEVAVEKFKGVPYDILDVAAKQVRPTQLHVQRT